MPKAFRKDDDTFIAIKNYIYGSLGYIVNKVTYAGTHSNNGLTPIIHYDVEYMIPASRAKAQEYREMRVTVYWNNDVPADAIPTITRMDVM